MASNQTQGSIYLGNQSGNQCQTIVDNGKIVDDEQKKKIKILQKIMSQSKKQKNYKHSLNVRLLIDAISSQNLNKNQSINTSTSRQLLVKRKQNQFSFLKQQEQKLKKSFFTINSQENQSSKKLKSMSRLLHLKKDQLEMIQKDNENYRKKQVQKAIYQKIDQIHHAFNKNSFYSIPHFSKNSNHSKVKSVRQQSKLQNSFDDDKTYSLMTSKRSLQPQQTELQSNLTNIYKNTIKYHRSLNKQKINKIKAQQGYFNTIKNLDLKKKFQINKKLLYHTIDPEKTQKWFYKEQNTKKKIYDLLKQKKQLKQSKKIQQTNNSQQIENKLVSKLLSRSKQKNKSLVMQLQQTMKLNDNSKKLTVSNKAIFKPQDYKSKGKKYFKIQLQKLHSDIHKKSNTMEISSRQRVIPQLLPQIKIYRKFKV